MALTETAVVGRRSARPHPVVIAVMAGAASVLWFTLLSGWLGVQPGSVLVKRQNVLFNSDTNTWIEEMVYQHEPSASTKVVHPLDVFLWRPPSQALYHVLQIFLPAEPAGLLAARLLVALVAGSGVGCLAFLALQNGIEIPQCLLLVSMYLLFTSSSTTALPEHFGISNGLLSIAFVVPSLTTNLGLATGVLAALVPLAGGTTITNVLYPLSSLYQFRIRSVRARRAIFAGALVASAIAIFLFIDSRKVVLNYTDADPEIASRVAILPAHIPAATRWYLKTTGIHIHVGDYLNLRLLHEPLDAAVYAIYALVAPAVGPTPHVRTTKGQDMVTYESSRPLRWNPNGFFTGSDGLHLSDYWGVQAVGAVMWTALLIGCSYQAFHDRRARPLVWLPAGWIVFNIVFHNMWGDELFLYAPHWSWALIGMVILGARRLSRTVTALVVMPVMVCQIYTLFRIKSALLTIVR